METTYTVIDVSERGTVAAMKWIAENNCPDLEHAIFSCSGRPYLIVSSQVEQDIWAILEQHPVSTWHDINGMKRIARSQNDNPCWYFCINDHFYFATIW